MSLVFTQLVSRVERTNLGRLLNTLFWGMRRLLHIIGALTLTALPSLAGEFAVLASGAMLPADRHRMEGDRVRLFHNGGETQLPAALIVRFEDDGRPAPLPPMEPKSPELASTPVAAPVASGPRTPIDLAIHAATNYSLPEAFVRSVMGA